MEALLGEVAVTLEKARHIVNFGESYLKPQTRPTPALFANRKCIITYNPMGVIAAIVPWVRVEIQFTLLTRDVARSISHAAHMMTSIRSP